MTSFYNSVKSTRRYQRVSLAVPIKISTYDNSREPAMVCTYEVSLKGCSIWNSMGLSTVDQRLWIHRKNRKAMYKVVWIGASGSRKHNQVGLEIAESSKVIWDDEIANKLN